MIQTAYVFTNDSLFCRCNEVSVSRELVRPTLEILSHGYLSTISLCSRLPSVLCVFISGLPFFFLQSVLFCILYLLDYRLHLACFGLYSFLLPYLTLPFPFPFFSLSRLSYYILGLLCCLFLYFLPIRFVKSDIWQKLEPGIPCFLRMTFWLCLFSDSFEVSFAF